MLSRSLSRRDASSRSRRASPSFGPAGRRSVGCCSRAWPRLSAPISSTSSLAACQRHAPSRQLRARAPGMARARARPRGRTWPRASSARRCVRLRRSPSSSAVTCSQPHTNRHNLYSPMRSRTHLLHRRSPVVAIATRPHTVTRTMEYTSRRGGAIRPPLSAPPPMCACSRRTTRTSRCLP